MAKISLENITSGFNLQKINANFQKIQSALQNKVYYRDNPFGEPNSLLTDLDVNGRAIYNLPEPTVASQAARLQDVQNAIGNQATANLTAFTPTGGLLATNVQAAIAEILTKGASLFTWAQAYSGAKVRTIQDRLRDQVYITDFAGVDPTGVSDSTAAAQAATNTGNQVVFPAGTYRIDGVAYTGRLDWRAEGEVTILCDNTIIAVQNGTGSRFKGFKLQNITAPWIISRDPNNFAAVPVPVQSNGPGYQPTVNDYDVWPSLTAAQQNQNIGPTLYFYGNSTDIEVSNITGNFVNIAMYDCRYSSVHDCSFRAGKLAGGILWWNINAQSGLSNKTFRNTIDYPSFCGVTYAGNIGGQTYENVVNNPGESGFKYTQNTAGGADARCYQMVAYDNESNYAFYDGFDFQADYPSTLGKDTRHKTYNNKALNPYGTGFISDGRNNQFYGNSARDTGKSGFLLTMQDSTIRHNYGYNCSTRGFSGEHQMVVQGPGCHITNNYLFRGNGIGYAIYSPFPGIASNNFAYDGEFFWGNAGDIKPTLMGNYDNLSEIKGVLNTIPQAIRQNNSNVPALTLYSDAEGYAYTDLVIHPRRHALANPSSGIRSVVALGTSGSEVGATQIMTANAGVLRTGLTVQADAGIPDKAWAALHAPNVNIVPGLLPSGAIAFWLDETTNQMRVSVKYSNNTVKTASINLV